MISEKSDRFGSILEISVKHRITYFLFEVYFVSPVFAKFKSDVLLKVFSLNFDHFQGKYLQNLYEFKRLKALIIVELIFSV